MSLKNAIALSFIYLTVYGLSLLFEWTIGALFLGSISPVVILWLVFKILKDPNPSENTFEDRFYEDYEYRRNR